MQVRVGTIDTANNDIQKLIDWAEEMKSKGATNFYFVPGDKEWDFKWIEAYRIKSEEEIKQERIKELTSELEELQKDPGEQTDVTC